METTDKSYQLMACHYIDGQLKKLSREIDGARECRDIECIHQSRVASRRLRAALVIFENCFPAKAIKKWRKEIKSLTKAFGPARDTDVQIEYLKKMISDIRENKKAILPGIKRLLLRTTQRREKLQSKVIKTIDKLESKSILADIHSAIERILFCIHVEEADLKNEYVFRQTSEHIQSKLNELLSHQNSLDNPEDKSGHHQMRIAAKRLRYTMEICREPYEGRLDNTIKIIKKLQTLLGDIHDCDVWIEHIEHFKKEEFERTKEYFGNEKERRQSRKQLFEILVRYWKKLNTHNVIQSIAKLAEHDSLEPKLKETDNTTGKQAFEIAAIGKKTSNSSVKLRKNKQSKITFFRSNTIKNKNNTEDEITNKR